jgi:hypothetical protein
MHAAGRVQEPEAEGWWLWVDSLTTWAISYEKLSKQAATFLNVCAFLHHDGITEAIFQNALPMSWMM